MKPIILPKYLDLKSSLEFGEKLNSSKGNTDYLFDFSPLKYIGPFGLVYISSCIEDLCNRCPNNEPEGTGYENLGYPAHMGFFKIFDLDHGNSPGQAKGSDRYIPITILDALEIRRESASSGIAIGSIIEKESQRLATVLSQEVEGDVYETLAYSMREILRNAVEHSHSNSVRFCAQYFPKQDRVEVVILDKGRGIKKSFERNPYINPQSHKEAINYSLMPGVSGTAFKGSKINARKDDWKNSGYGLYMTTRICRLGGDFFIGSYDSGILLHTGRKKYLKLSHNGTLLRLTIKPSQATNLRSRLLQFSNEGKVIASQIQGTVLTPSSASHMLTMDYLEE